MTQTCLSLYLKTRKKLLGFKVHFKILAFQVNRQDNIWFKILHFFPLKFFLAPHIPLSVSPLFPLSTLFPSSCTVKQEACPPPHKQSRLVGRNRTSSSMTHPKVPRSRTPPAFTRHPRSFQAAYPRVGSPWRVCLSPCPRVRPCWWTSRLRCLEVSSR